MGLKGLPNPEGFKVPSGIFEPLTAGWLREFLDFLFLTPKISYKTYASRKILKTAL